MAEDCRRLADSQVVHDRFAAGLTLWKPLYKFAFHAKARVYRGAH